MLNIDQTQNRNQTIKMYAQIFVLDELLREGKTNVTTAVMQKLGFLKSQKWSDQTDTFKSLVKEGVFSIVNVGGTSKTRFDILTHVNIWPGIQAEFDIPEVQQEIAELKDKLALVQLQKKSTKIPTPAKELTVLRDVESKFCFDSETFIVNDNATNNIWEVIAGNGLCVAVFSKSLFRFEEDTKYGILRFSYKN